MAFILLIILHYYFIYVNQSVTGNLQAHMLLVLPCFYLPNKIYFWKPQLPFLPDLIHLSILLLVVKWDLFSFFLFSYFLTHLGSFCSVYIYFSFSFIHMSRIFNIFWIRFCFALFLLERLKQCTSYWWLQFPRLVSYPLKQPILCIEMHYTLCHNIFILVLCISIKVTCVCMSSFDTLALLLSMLYLNHDWSCYIFVVKLVFRSYKTF